MNKQEIEAFEAAFNGYSATVRDNKLSAIYGCEHRKPSNMFRVWLFLRAQLAMATDAADKGDEARLKAGEMQAEIERLKRTIAGMNDAHFKVVQRVNKARHTASMAIRQIEDVRRGCNVTQDEIWAACEHLDTLLLELAQGD